MNTPPFDEGTHQYDCADRMAEYLEELMQNGGPEAAMKALEWSMKSWYDYHQTEANKWLKLMAMVRSLD